MRLRLGCQLDLYLPQTTPIVALLNIHDQHQADLETPDQIFTNPGVSMTTYRDNFGNLCTRFIAPAGPFTISTDTIIRDDGKPDPFAPDARQVPVEDLPPEVLVYLLGSRYCDTDLLSDTAWNLFQWTKPGWSRVQAICDHVHNHLRFDYLQARSTRTAAQAHFEQVGVCRDFTHLAITLCRAMNIPARYCTGYISDVNLPPPYAPGDFCAWMEVWLDDQWWTFDPRNNAPRYGRVLMARGRDAADVPILQSFGLNALNGFRVWTDELPDVPGQDQATLTGQSAVMAA